jgi:AcrR family transcriptional regulator
MSDAVVASAEALEDPSADRLRERRQRRRDELIGSIAAFIRVEGPDVSMDQIAAACGVTKPIIYRHFGDRDGMVRALSARYAGVMASLAAEAEVEPEPASANEVLRRQVDNYLGLIEQDTNLYRFLSANKPAGPEGEHLLDAVAEQVRRIVAGFLEADGRSTAPAATIAYALTGMVHQVGQWWLVDRTATREQLVDQLVTIAWSGLGSDDIAEPVAPAAAARRNDN